MIRNDTKVVQYNKGNCIYIIGYTEMKNMYKIGKTKNMNTRISSYITCNPHSVNVLHMKFIENMTLAENVIKVTLKEYHHVGDGGKEWYKCDDINILKDEVNAVINFLNNRIYVNAIKKIPKGMETIQVSSKQDTYQDIDKLFKDNHVVLCDKCEGIFMYSSMSKNNTSLCLECDC